jgi:hypothetical protein
LALTTAAIDSLLRGAPVAEVEKDLKARREAALAMQATLTDFRIYWDVVSQALTGRELILIDAAKIKAGRNLFLADPDQFRPNWPMLLPSMEKGKP